MSNDVMEPQVPGEPHLKTADGTGQRYGAMNVGMLGLCGPESRRSALEDLADRHAEDAFFAALGKG